MIYDLSNKIDEFIELIKTGINNVKEGKSTQSIEYPITDKVSLLASINKKGEVYSHLTYKTLNVSHLEELFLHYPLATLCRCINKFFEHDVKWFSSTYELNTQKQFCSSTNLFLEFAWLINILAPNEKTFHVEKTSFGTFIFDGKKKSIVFLGVNNTAILEKQSTLSILDEAIFLYLLTDVVSLLLKSINFNSEDKIFLEKLKFFLTSIIYDEE